MASERPTDASNGKLCFCRYHCSSCDSCWHTLAAFDAHRAGGSNDRYCLEPLDDPRFTAVTESGACILLTPEPRIGRTVWALLRDAAVAA